VNPTSLRRLFLALIVASQLAFSIIGIDWGLPYLWHTDEKFDQVVFMISDRKLDPDYFVNPHLEIYTLAGVVAVAYVLHPHHVFELGLKHIVPLTWTRHPGRSFQFLVARVGRGLSVVLSMLTILVVYRLGRRDFGETEGLLASAFLASTMGFINMAHFATVEPMLLLMVVCALGAYTSIVQSDSVRAYAVAGIFTGLAFSTKYTAILLWVPFFVSHVAGRGLDGMRRPRTWLPLLISLGTAAAAFCLTTPYAIIRWHTFWTDGILATFHMGAPNGNLLGVRRSFVPYFWLLADALGWPLFIVGILGAAFGVVRHRFTDRSQAPWLVHTTWILAFYGFYGLSPHHALRFIMPIVPSLTLLGAAASLEIVRRTRQAPRAAAVSAVIAVIVYSAVYTARADWMFLHDTRYEAGKWLRDLRLTSTDTIEFFALDAYLPFFDRPVYKLYWDPLINDMSLRGGAFAQAAEKHVAGSQHIFVDSEFYYARFFDARDRFDDRVTFYEKMLGEGIGRMRLVARFRCDNPGWLNPRPERIAPEVDVFADPDILAPHRGADGAEPGLQLINACGASR